MVRLDRALDKAGLAATTAVEALVHLLGKGTQVALQLANGVLVALTIHAGESGAPPATSLEDGIAQAAPTIRGQALLKEKHISCPSELTGQGSKAILLHG